MEELREVLLPLKLFKSSLWNCVFVLNWLLISLTSLWNCVFVLNWLLISLTSWQGTPLVFQWLRIRLAMWGTQVRSLVRQLRSPIPWPFHCREIKQTNGRAKSSPNISQRILVLIIPTANNSIGLNLIHLYCNRLLVGLPDVNVTINSPSTSFASDLSKMKIWSCKFKCLKKKTFNSTKFV